MFYLYRVRSLLSSPLLSSDVYCFLAKPDAVKQCHTANTAVISNLVGIFFSLSFPLPMFIFQVNNSQTHKQGGNGNPPTGELAELGACSTASVLIKTPSLPQGDANLLLFNISSVDVLDLYKGLLTLTVKLKEHLVGEGDVSMLPLISGATQNNKRAYSESNKAIA